MCSWMNTLKRKTEVSWGKSGLNCGLWLSLELAMPLGRLCMLQDGKWDEQVTLSHKVPIITNITSLANGSQPQDALVGLGSLCDAV